MTIQMKTRGMLIDEWITSAMKYGHTPSSENRWRVEALNHAINDCTTEYELRKIAPTVAKLTQELSDCWDAQECIMQYRDADLTQLPYSQLQELGTAAILAQVTNGRRNALIREIDRLLGDEATPLQKTYM